MYLFHPYYLQAGFSHLGDTEEVSSLAEDPKLGSTPGIQE